MEMFIVIIYIINFKNTTLFLIFFSFMAQVIFVLTYSLNNAGGPTATNLYKYIIKYVKIVCYYCVYVCTCMCILYACVKIASPL